MTVKIKDKEVYEYYVETLDHVCLNKFDQASLFLVAMRTSNNIDDVKKVVNAILDGEKVELAELKYNLVIFEQSNDYYSAFYQFNNELNVIDDVNEYDLRHDEECHFTQTEIDKYNKINGLNIDLNDIKVPVEELDD